MKHTKNEWKMISATDSDEYAYIASGSQYVVSNIRKEIARRICQCVNSHDDLLAALSSLLKRCRSYKEFETIYPLNIQTAEAAIAKAKDY